MVELPNMELCEAMGSRAQPMNAEVLSGDNEVHASSFQHSFLAIHRWFYSDALAIHA